MVGYKSYDNINHQWNYYEVNQEPVYKPTSSINLPLVQKVLAEKQNAYNTNSQRISNAVDDMRNWLNNANINSQTKDLIKFSFNKFHLEPMYAKGYDYSDTAFVNQIIQSLYDNFNKTVQFEIDSFNKELSKPILKDEPAIGSYYTLNRRAILWDMRNMGKANSLGEIPTLKVYVLEKSNETFYKVKSGNKTGYITASNFK